MKQQRLRLNHLVTTSIRGAAFLTSSGDWRVHSLSGSVIVSQSLGLSTGTTGMHLQPSDQKLGGRGGRRKLKVKLHQIFEIPQLVNPALPPLPPLPSLQTTQTASSSLL